MPPIASITRPRSEIKAALIARGDLFGIPSAVAHIAYELTANDADQVTVTGTRTAATVTITVSRA